MPVCGLQAYYSLGGRWYHLPCLQMKPVGASVSCMAGWEINLPVTITHRGGSALNYGSNSHNFQMQGHFVKKINLTAEQ